MKFKKRDLLSMLRSDESVLIKIQDEISDHLRWSVAHDVVFQDRITGRYFRSYYSEGATESQDESPWQWDPEEIECDEVRPVEKVVIVYEPI